MCTRIPPLKSNLLHPVISHFSWLLGSWHGHGNGYYPTVQPFKYYEVSTFHCYPEKPYLVYTQKTWAVDHKNQAIVDKVMHVESGYVRFLWRNNVVENIEFVVSDPTGEVQVYTGIFEESTPNTKKLAFTSTGVYQTPTAKEVSQIERVFTYCREPESLSYTLHMKAVGQPLSPHLDATLSKHPHSYGMERDVPELDVEEFKQKKDAYVIIDCREEAEYKEAHIDGAIHIPAGYLLSQAGINDPKIASLKDKKILLYCRSGSRSQKVGEELLRNGFENTVHLKGGFAAWNALNASTNRN
jgi:rhodanese-related sulfurtransferase